MTYAETTNAWLVGKTVKKADVSGHGVYLEFEDGSKLNYDASDGGYSCWGMKQPNGEAYHGES